MSTHAATAEATSQRSSLLRSRLGSFLALFPLSVWVVNHLWDNLAAFQGAEAWERSVTHHPHPFASLFTWVIVFLPLVIPIVVGGVGASIADDPGRYLGFLGLYDLIFAILSWASFEYVVTE